MICNEPLPPEVPEAVIVAVPVVPPSVALGDVVLDPVTLIMLELLELQFAAALELKPILEPVPPLAERLTEFPEQLLQVMVIACPTVTVDVPLNPLYVAVMVTELLVFCSALTKPVALTVTNVCVVSELSQIARLVTSFVLPSLFVAIAVSCRAEPAERLFVAGLTLRLVTVGLTKKPLQLAATASNTAMPKSRNRRLVRVESSIFKTPREEFP